MAERKGTMDEGQSKSFHLALVFSVFCEKANSFVQDRRITRTLFVHY